jgi:hypothetical protein
VNHSVPALHLDVRCSFNPVSPSSLGIVKSRVGAGNESLCCFACHPTGDAKADRNLPGTFGYFDLCNIFSNALGYRDCSNSRGSWQQKDKLFAP